jgi:hypothetical protein
MLSCLIGLFAFISCGTTHVVYDNSIPAERTAIIQPSADLYFNSFDSNDVLWAPGFWKGTAITIPSGEHSLTVGLNNAQSGRYTYLGGKYGLTYNFEPGHFYRFTFQNVMGEDEIAINIMDKTTGNKVEMRATVGNR